MAKQTNAAYLLSLVGGILILVGSLTMLSGMGFMVSMMSYMIGGFGYFYMSIAGLISGLLVLYGAFMLNNKPKERKTWGMFVLIFSLVSLLSAGGFLIGAVLGVLGGVFAISEK